MQQIKKEVKKRKKHGGDTRRGLFAGRRDALLCEEHCWRDKKRNEDKEVLGFWVLWKRQKRNNAKDGAVLFCGELGKKNKLLAFCVQSSG